MLTVNGIQKAGFEKMRQSGYAKLMFDTVLSVEQRVIPIEKRRVQSHDYCEDYKYDGKSDDHLRSKLPATSVAVGTSLVLRGILRIF